MASHSLPDDLSHWPTDAYRLLGIGHRCDRRALRQAYVHLIRQFKPDEFPEHFQRIHAAYEKVRERIPARRVPVDQEPSSPQADGVEGGSGDVSKTGGTAAGNIWVRLQQEDESARELSSPSRGSERPPHTPENELQAIWRRAVDGQHQEAYEQLLSLRRRGTMPADVCVRLYWLLATMPELDGARSPCDWLVEAVRQTRLTGTAMHLYVREIRDNPQEALRSRCAELVKCPAEFNDRFRLLGFRWRALSFLETPAPILVDLEEVRKHRASTDTQTWALLLVLALQQMAWFQADETVREGFERLRGELEELGQLCTDVHTQLADVDMLADVASGWYTVTANRLVGEYWGDLVRFAYTQHPEAVRREMLRVLGRIAREPKRAFRELDYVRENSSAVFHYLGSLILNEGRETEKTQKRRDGEPELLLLRYLLLRGKDVDNRLYRCPPSSSDRRMLAYEYVLDFSLHEAIPPAVIEGRGDVIGRILKKVFDLFSDMPLDVTVIFRDPGSMGYVYEACQRFWTECSS